MSQSLYTPERANATLPLVRRIVADIVDLTTRLDAENARYERAKKRSAQADQVELNALRRELDGLATERDACVDELGDLSVFLADADLGACDFPGRQDGELVFLCWQLGEERVGFYHHPNEGYSARRPLPVPVSVT